MNRRAFSVAIYAVFDGKILLIEHKRLKCWLPVGGELEFGRLNSTGFPETPVEAAARKLLQETQLTGRFPPSVVVGSPPGFVSYEEHDAGSRGLHLNFNFTCFVDSNVVVGDGSFGEWAWLTPHKITELENVPANVRQVVMGLNVNSVWSRK
jgi:ADP-ribose pyrophosphatase YjhB (NUDIX family)